MSDDQQNALREDIKELADFALQYGKAYQEVINEELFLGILEVANLAGDLVDWFKDTYRRDPATAITALVVATAAGALIGVTVLPDVAAFAAFSVGLAEAGIVEATAVQILFRVVIGLAASQGMQLTIRTIFGKLPELSPFVSSLGPSFDLSADAVSKYSVFSPSSSYHVLSSKYDLGGRIVTTLESIPGVPQSVTDVSLLQNQFIRFDKNTFSELTENAQAGTPTFTAFLRNSAGQNDGSLKINLNTNAISYNGIGGLDGATVDLGAALPVLGQTQFHVGLSKSGATILNIAKNGNSIIPQGQLVVDVDKNGHQVIGSNIANLSIVNGAGIDTLLNLGANDKIDAGGVADPQAGQITAQYELQISPSGNLQIGSSPGDSISLKGTGFVKSSDTTLDGTQGDTSLIFVNDVDEGVSSGSSGNNVLIAAGTNDLLQAVRPGQVLVALGQSGDTLQGQETSSSGLDKLIAIKGKVVGGSTSAAGVDTLEAGIGNNIMVGEGVDTTFEIDASAHPKAIDVVWAQGGKDTINISGSAAVFVINAPTATLSSVTNLDLQKLSQQIWKEEGVLDQGDPALGDVHDPRLPPFFNEPSVFVINPTADDKLVINGKSLSGDISSSVRQSGALNSSDYYPAVISHLNQINYNVVEFLEPHPGDELTSWIMGFSPGNFGITNASGSLPEDVDSSSMLANGTPKVNLANLQVQASANASGGSGGGTDPSVIDRANVYLTDVSDTLLSIGAATAFGTNDTLVAANGADTLTASGNQDTLIGNGAGSTLVNNGGNYSNNVAAYAIDDVAVDLGTFGSNETATINGSSISDTLVNITKVEALGTNDTLISRRSDSTLIASAAGNTLIGEAGATMLGNGGGSTLISGNGVAWYQADHSVVNLATGRANVGAASIGDTLIGVQNAVIYGTGSTLIGGGSGGDTLTAYGAYSTLIAGAGTESLASHGWYNTLIGGGGTDYLSSDGIDNTLIAGSGADILSSTGFDTLIGNGAGSQLLTSSGGVAEYTIDNVVVDLGANQATIQGSSVSDTLQNIAIAEALGNHDTLIGGSSRSTLIALGSHDVLQGASGVATLISNANGNTLIAGTAQTTADYSANNITVDLGAATALVSGSSASDTLIGINQASVSGQHDTLIGGSVADVLIVDFPGTGNTLIAGSGAETLISKYSTGNTLIGGTGSDTLSSSGSGDVLLAGDGASETLSSSGNGNTLVAGAGVDTLSTSGSGDTLLGGSGASILSASGYGDSLISGSGSNTLSATGMGDTLFGNGGGSTLSGGAGTGIIAAYTANNVTVDLATGTAGVNGSGTVDTLLGIGTAAALGRNDTLVDGDAGSTLFSDAAGNTLIGGSGETVAAYTLSNLTVNLSTGSAGVNGAGVSDVLMNISTAAVSGSHDTVLAGIGTNVLSSSGSSNTLVAGGGTDTLSSTGTGNTLIGGAGADTLSSNGTNDILIAGNGSNIVTSSGSGNSLLAGSGVGTLSTSGSGDTLFGNGNGSTLDATSGAGATLAYTADDVAIDIGAGTATINGASASDKLTGFSTFAALGSNETLIDGANGATLFSDAAGNTLVGGAGQTTAAYKANGVTVDLAAGTATALGASVSDTLVGIHVGLVAGSNDVLVGDGASDLLASSGSSNTLIAGTAIDTLSSTGNGDTFFGNLLGSTLEAGFNAIAVYTQSNATIDLTAGTAAFNGASVSDQLVGFSAIEALGSHDTLVGGAGYNASTLISNAAGNTLIGGTAGATAVYEIDNVTVNLVAGTAAINGAGETDVLTNIFAAAVSGNNDTIISGGIGNTLTAANASDVVIYSRDNISIDLLAGTAGVNGTNAEDKLIGVSSVLVSGAGASVTGGIDAGVLQASGANDLLIAGAVSEMLIASGTNDTLAGNLAGSILQATAGATGSTILYTYDDVTIDLGAGTASGPASNVSDTLIGTHAIAVAGAYDTVLAGSGTDTLSSTGSFNSLVGGGGADTLISSGQDDVLTGGSGAQTLISHGAGNTLIAGGAVDLLLSTGTNDSLVGNAAGSTLNATGSTGAVAAYAIDYVTVDLGAGTAAINGAGTRDTLIGIQNATVSGIGDAIVGGGGTEILSATGANDTLTGGEGAATLVSSGSQNSLIAGSGNDTLESSGTADVLTGGAFADVLISSGSNNTLIAGGSGNSLSSSGTDDTLIGNGAGSTLDGRLGTGTIAAYALNNMTIDLAAGTAGLNGSGVSDVLVGISTALASGTGDTLIGGAGATTLYSNASGNTLESGTGQTTVAYTANGVSVNLATDSASLSGSSATDTLVGIVSAVISGANATLTGGAGTETLTSSGLFNTVIAGSGSNLLASGGIGDTLIGGSGADTLSSSGQNNTLIAGSASNLLVSTGDGDTLLGNAAGSTLDGVHGINVLANYAINNVKIDLSAGTATINGSGLSDTLLGITAVAASGHGDTLIGGVAATTLSSNGNGNTLVAGAGATTALYKLDNMSVDLATSSATVNGSGVADTLIGITSAVVAGVNDTLIGATGSDVLVSSGEGNTLVSGSGIDTLVSTGFGDTLVGNGVGSTLDGTNGSGAIVAYSLNNVRVDLGIGSATISGSGISDTLVGIGAALALGTGDTLIGASGVTTLASNAAGNTLIAGSGRTVAAYDANGAVVNLGTGTASITGSPANDRLIGISAATVSGADDTLVGNGAGDLLTANGSKDTVIGGSGADTLIAEGTSDTLSAGSGTTTLMSSGIGNLLIAGSSADALISTGFDDTLYGNALGSTLDATAALGGVAAYTANNLTLNLATGLASVNGTDLSDTLLGFSEAAVLGTNDTLVAGLGDETLFGGGGANTYVYASADGNDVIEDAGNSSQAIFSDIASTGVTFAVSSQNSNDLLITTNGTGKTVTVDGQFSTAGQGKVQDFTFADGVTLSAAQVATLAGAGSGSPPTVDVSIDRSLLNVTNPTATVTFAFSAAPAAFTLADTSVIGGALSNLIGSGTTYTATFTAAAGTDISNASVSVNANSWQSGGTNGGGGSTPAFTVDTVTPTVAISVDHSTLNVAGPTALVTFTFSDAPTSFTLADTNVAGGVLSNLTGSGTTYTATFTAGGNTQTANASVAVNAGSWQNADGNAGASGASSTFNVDTVTPAVSSITASPSSGDENTDNVIYLTLTMNKSVSVTGTPALTLNDGGSAVYQSGSGTSRLVFAYTVANGQNISALAVTGNNLGGSGIAIADADGNTADLTGADVSFPGLMVGATVASVTASPSGDLGPGKVVTFTVTTTEAVAITGGTPTLALNDGGVATYKSGSGTNILKFTYTVGAIGSGQNTNALAVTGFNANGATVYDSGIAADTADLSGVTSFANGPQVDTTAPTVSSVTAAPSTGDLNAGNSITISVGFSEAITVTGSPYLALNDGGKATYVGGSGSNTLTFTYTVAAGQNTTALAVSSMSTNGGTIKDAAGNSAVLSGAASNLGGAIQIDTKAPAVTEHLTSDTGVSRTDLITSNDSLTGGGDANAIVHFAVDGSAIATTATASSTGAWTFVPTGLADGLHTVVASETDAAGNTGTATLTFTQDTTAPSATAISTSPANGDLDAGNTVTLTVQFNDTVYATSTSYLLLNDGGKALYSSGTGTNSLTFTYTVAAGQNTADLAVTAFGAGLTDVAGNAALLAGTVTNPGGTIQIDTTAPKVTSIATSGTGIVAGKGDLGPGQTATLTVNFGEAVLVNTTGGTPTLALSNGGVATYVSGSGSSALTFAYTVGALGSGQDSADLKLAATNAVNLNGGIITDLAGNPGVLTAANNYNPAGVLQIDTTAPAITTVVSSPTTGDVTTGHVVKITLTPSEAVTVSGTPELLLNVGGMATYDAAHSTSKALVFNYTAAAGDSTPNLAISGIEIPTGSSINDLAGNSAALAGAAKSLGVQINTTAAGSSGPETGNITLSGSSNAELFGASLANVTFASGSTGTLRLDASSQFTGTVAGLGLGNYVDLADLPYQGNNAPVYGSTGTNTGSVAVTEGATTINVALLGSYMANSFVASSDGHGGTLITDPPPPPQVVLGPSLHA